MTATVIKFPVVKLPAERPLREREIIRDDILTAVNMVALGLGPENLSARMDPDKRETIELAMSVAREV